MASHDTVRERSLFGAPPLWSLEIRPVSGHIQIDVRPELLWFEQHRRAIDELASVLAMRLHGLTRSQQEMVERLSIDSGGQAVAAVTQSEH